MSKGNITTQQDKLNEKACLKGQPSIWGEAALSKSPIFKALRNYFEEWSKKDPTLIKVGEN